ncbi:unnamed protein product [Prorocentrum cordatum]|uniref:FAD-binding PCMH-type domain-containing protein n=1 Tax=Prorocentrum cordatum TaxID=2364126 RepID=A0ABN9W7Y6_9DINO|nr:unnamed protein product [Polarella glacialis]
MKLLDVHRLDARANTTQQTPACDGSGLSATVVRVGDANYDTARSQFATIGASSATADERIQPQMIIFCTVDSHVQEAVSLAEVCGFTISVRSGGHNYAAYSSCPASSPQCIQVDLSGMETFSLNQTTVPAEVTIGAGLTLEQVYASLAPHGLAVPGGICKTVGVGGHYQSSAAGYYGRAFGLGIDVVKSFRIVMADAQVHTVDNVSDPDLYWSVLGGGPGSWGVVLDYTLETFADADYPNFKTFTFLYPYSRAMLHALGSVYTSQSSDTLIDRDVLILFMVHPGILFGIPGSTDEHYIMVRFVWMGMDNGALTGSLYDAYVKPWEDIPHMTLAPVMSMPISVFPGAMATSWDLGPFRYHIHAFGMKSQPSTAFWDAIADEVDIRVAIPNLYFSWQINPAGGQMDRNAGKNAYVVRYVKNWVDDWVFFLGDALADVAEERIVAFREATEHFWEEDNVAHSWMTPDTLINNTHSGPADFAMNESWFARLQDVKTRVDPTDLFHMAVTIPPRASASAVGDPHLQNVHGERFDLLQPGRHTLLEIPRRAAAESVLLLVEAEARHDGSACADVYFRALNITGQWPEARAKGGLRFRAHDDTRRPSKWMNFAGVSLRVAHGHTTQGARYLNLYVKHLSKTGFAIGGLLGEDDHEMASTPLESCRRSTSLLSADTSAPAASTAEASLE